LSNEEFIDVDAVAEGVDEPEDSIDVPGLLSSAQPLMSSARAAVPVVR
jgi:hypothetical protein